MYRYGDGTPFPIQENFIETLLAAIDACVGTFSAAAEIEDRREKTRVARREAEEELRRFAVMEKAVESALAPMRPSSDKHASSCQQGAARALGAARHAFGQSRGVVEERLRALAAEPRVERVLERARTALACFFEHHQLPETGWRASWTWNGKAAIGEAVAVTPRFRAAFDLALEAPWTGVVRVGSIAPGLEASVVRRKLFGGMGRAQRRLDACGITQVESANDRAVIVLREQVSRPSPGWKVILRDPDRSGPVLIALDLAGQRIGDELALEGDAAPFERLWGAAADEVEAMRDGRRRLNDLRVGDVSLDKLDPGQVGRALLAVLGPLIRQIRAHSRVPGELAIKRDLGNGRREELYVPRVEIERRYAVLPAIYRRVFEELGLGRDATAELESFDDLSTQPEGPTTPRAAPPRPPPRIVPANLPGLPKLIAPVAKPPPIPAPPETPVPESIPEAIEAVTTPDALKRLPSVPPTAPRLPMHAEAS